MKSRRTVLLFVWLTLSFVPAAVLFAQAVDSAEPASAGAFLLHNYAQASPERTIPNLSSSVVLVGSIIVLQSILIFALLFERNRKNRAARRLAESEERFAKVFRANPQPMVITTLKEGRFVDMNESAMTLTGYTREEIIGQTSL